MPTFSHSKDTVIKVGSVDISAHCNTSTFTVKGTAEDVTTYGSNSVVKAGSLNDASFTLGGFYSPAVTGTPAAVFLTHMNETLSITRMPTGSGVGKPQQVFSGVLVNYVETNATQNRIQWTADLEVTGDINYTSQ